MSLSLLVAPITNITVISSSLHSEKEKSPLLRPKKKVSGFWSLRTSAFFILFYLFFGHETMSNCRQNCWIDWNSAVLCFKRLFLHRGMNVCEASLSHHTLYMGNLVPAYTMYHDFPAGKKKR